MLIGFSVWQWNIYFFSNNFPLTQSRQLRWMEDHYSGSLILLHWWWVVYCCMSQLFSGGNYNCSQQSFHCWIHVNTFILSALLQTCRPFMWKSEPALRKDYRIPKVKHGLTWSLFHQEVDSQDVSLLSEKAYCQVVLKSITFQMGSPLLSFTQTLSMWLRGHRLCVLKPADDTDAYC